MFLDTSTATFSVLHIIYIYMIEEILKRENPGQLVVSLDNLRTVIHKIQVEAAQDTSLSKMAQVLPTPNHEDRYLTREEAAEFCHVSKIPQKTVMAQITQNDLQGSKRLYNLFDSVFAIGQSAKDEDLRYIKELKVRWGRKTYGENNVIVAKIEKIGSFLQFTEKGNAHEFEHLKQSAEETREEIAKTIEDLRKKGVSYRNIGEQLSMPKSTVESIDKRTRRKKARK